jgi:UDP-glucose 4-epimerase
MNVLLAGGAGYIGSHMALLLVEAGHAVTVLDDLSAGHAQALPGVPLVVGSVADGALLARVFARQHFDGVMHFAAHIEVSESTYAPGKYYRNNFCGTLALLDCMVRFGVSRLVFSSSAAVYGTPERSPVEESAPCRPLSAYGKSKWMVEQALQDYDLAHGLKSVCLRYFNAAGADPAMRVGESHEPESHLIPLVLQAASGRRNAIQVYGRDYDTPDGTCIRDYVHVFDICAAHLLALRSLAAGGASRVFNLGNGRGFSVQEVMDAAARVTARRPAVEERPRRAGDPPRLVADATRARLELGWSPQYPELDTMIRHAWQWEQTGRSNTRQA